MQDIHQNGNQRGMPMTSHGDNTPSSFRIHAGRMFPGGGAAPLGDQIIEITAGMIRNIYPAAGQNADGALEAVTRFDIVTPGFIDLQINGAGGVMFNDTPDVPTLARMVVAARTGGTCHILPTFITAPGTAYRAALDAVAVWQGPEIPGIHLEGPFLSAARPGIHPPGAIRHMTDQDAELLTDFAEAYPGRLLLTLAPEEAEPAHLARLHAAGIILFAGHSQASGTELSRATDLGIRGVTHLFNACSQITARDPGVVGTALTDRRLVAGIIADGHHVDPGNLALASRMMAGRLCLVSDSMSSFGSNLDAFTIGDRQVRLVAGGRLQAEDGTLGGAHLGLDKAVRMMVTGAGVPLADALDMASGVPAEVLGLQDRYGRIEAGRPASLTCLDGNLTASAVIVEGVLSRNKGSDTGA